jgi:hypothetical protein
VRGIEDRLIVLGYADPEHWHDADYVAGAWGVLDAMAEGQARERLGLND